MINTMKKLTITISIIMAIIAGVTVYLQFFHKEEVKLNIQKVSEVQLDTSLDVESLESTFIYNDSTKVENLWLSTFKVLHIGNKDILSSEFKDATLSVDHIPFTIDNDEDILAINIIDQNISADILAYNRIKVKQWRPSEFIEISILSANKNAPQLRISDREIVGAEITYSEHNPKDIIYKTLITLYIYIGCVVILAIFGVLYAIYFTKSVKWKIFNIVYGLYILGVLICCMIATWRII